MGTEPTVQKGAGERVTLIDIATQQTEDADRVVFTFTGNGRPGWRAAFPSSQRAATGEPVLEIDFRNVADGTMQTPLYNGPARIRGADVVSEVEFTTDDGRPRVLVHLDEMHPFRLARRGDLVILEVAHY